MIAIKKPVRKSTKANWLMICIASAMMPCSFACGQTDPKESPIVKKPLEKKEAESKHWHETMEKFNGLVQGQKWREAEELANETASKFGHEDLLVQSMLLDSINGQRKSQGLAPLIIEKKDADTTAPFVALYSLKDTLPLADKDVPVFLDVLTQCISAAIDKGAEDQPDAKLVYDAENKRLLVAASKPQQQLVAAILKRLNKSTKR